MNNEEIKLKLAEPMEWQPAIIAPSEQVTRLHGVDTGEVSKFAGQRIRVRPSIHEVHSITIAMYCPTKQVIEVHPEDAKRLWPDMFPRYGQPIQICTCRVLMD